MIALFVAEINTIVDRAWCSGMGSDTVAAVAVVRPVYNVLVGLGAGLNKNLLCVVTGINDAGDIFFVIAGKGKPSCERMRSVLERRLCSGAIVTTDREQSYASVLKTLGVEKHDAYDDRDHGHLPHIDSYHSRIRHFLYRFSRRICAI